MWSLLFEIYIANIIIIRRLHIILLQTILFIIIIIIDQIKEFSEQWK